MHDEFLGLNSLALDLRHPLSIATLHRMPVTKKGKGRGPPKPKGPPLCISLLDSDDDGDMLDSTLADNASEEPTTSKAPKKAAAQSTGANGAHSQPRIPKSKSALLPAAKSTTAVPKAVPMRRSSTTALSQVHSKKSTALSTASLEADIRAIDDDNQPSEAEQEEDNLPVVAHKDTFEPLGDSDDEKEVVKSYPEQKSALRRTEDSPTSTPQLNGHSSASSRATLPNASGSLSHLTTKEEFEPAEPAIRKSESIFRSRDSIDAHLIRNSSSIQDLEDMVHDEPINEKKRRSSEMSGSQAHRINSALARMLTDVNDAEDIEDEGNEMLMSLLAPKAKKKATSRVSLISNLKSSLEAEVPTSTVKKLANEKVADPPSPVSVTSNPTSTATGSASARSKTNRPVESTIHRTPSNPDLLLAQVLGPASAARAAPSYSTPQYGRNAYSPDYASYSILATRQLLQQSRATDSRYASQSAYPPNNAAAHNAGAQNNPIRLTLKIGARELETSSSPSSTVSAFLTQLIEDQKLPALLLNETFFIKFDGLELSSSATLADSYIGNGDTLVVCVRRDGKELEEAFLELGDEPEEEAQNDNKISLQARFPDGKVVKYRISKDDPLEKLAIAAAKKAEVPVEKVRIKFDGDILPLKQSPVDLEEPLEDGDMVDIDIKK